MDSKQSGYKVQVVGDAKVLRLFLAKVWARAAMARAQAELRGTDSSTETDEHDTRKEAL